MSHLSPLLIYSTRSFFLSKYLLCSSFKRSYQPRHRYAKQAKEALARFLHALEEREGWHSFGSTSRSSSFDSSLAFYRLSSKYRFLSSDEHSVPIFKGEGVARGPPLAILKLMRDTSLVPQLDPLLKQAVSIESFEGAANGLAEVGAVRVFVCVFCWCVSGCICEMYGHCTVSLH